MRLRTLTQLPDCVRSADLAPGDGVDLGLLLRLSPDDMFGMMYRLRTWRITFDLVFTSPLKTSYHMGTAGPFDNHVDSAMFPTQQRPVANELELACLGASRGWPVNTQNVYRDEDDDPSSVMDASFQASQIYADAEFYYVDLVVGVSLFQRDEGETVGIQLGYFPGTGGSYPNVTSPWGPLYAVDVIGNDDNDKTVTGTIALEAASWWPFAKEDGSDPVVDAVTGEKLRDHRF